MSEVLVFTYQSCDSGAVGQTAYAPGVSLKQAVKGIVKKTALISLIFAVLAMTACSGGGGGDDDEESFMLTVLSPSGGQILQNPTGTYFKKGTKVTFTAVPDTDLDFVNWTNDGENSTDNPLTITIAKNTYIGAKFADLCELKVSAVAEGTGSFTIEPESANGLYEAGTTINLTAVPAPGYTFVLWQGDLQGSVLYTQHFNIAHDMDVKALFGPDGATYDLTIQIVPEGAGSVNLVPMAYPGNTEFEIVATPASGYAFASYSLGTQTSTNSTAKMTMPAEAATLTVTFEDASRDFIAQKATDSSWYTVHSTMLAEGEHCKVYVEDYSGVTTSTAAAVAAEFDDNIYGKITTNFGVHEDIDGDGKITLLLLDIIDGYDPSVGSYVAGYFDPTHMADADTDYHSNECDMLFLDVYPLEAGSDAFNSTIAHEFQHLINYSRTYMATGKEQDLWINEGLSSGAEYVYTGEVNEDRVAWFNADPCDGSISKGNNFFVWYGYWETMYNANCVLDNYATVSLFCQWLRIHASNGTAIYKDILDSTYRDYRAVTAAAGNRIGSAYSSWDRLLETWYLASFRCQSSGVYGYKGEIATNSIGWVQQNDTPYELESGEGIISALSATTGNVGTWSPPSGSGTHIAYAGFDYSGTSVDRYPSFTNQFALVLNTNSSNTAGQFEDVFIANVVSGLGDNPVARSIQSRIDSNKKELPALLNVGFHPGLKGPEKTAEQQMLKNRSRDFMPVKSIDGRKRL